MTVDFTDLGFERSYSVEVNPEYPSTGSWAVATVQFGEKGRERLTIKVRPSGGDPWVGSFALETRGVVTGLYACPNPAQLLVVTGLDAHLLDANEPTRATALPVHPVTVVYRPPDADLLLVGSFTDMAALDRSGLRWVTDRLFLDDLRVLSCSADVIRIHGRDQEVKQVVLALDLDSDHVLSRS